MPSLITLAGTVTGLLVGLGQSAPSLRSDLKPRLTSCNTASDRACWVTGYTIDTDYEADTPYTGVTRTFNWTLEEITSWTAPDGEVKTSAMLINGEYPGPTITADWGDTIEVTVNNNLNYNGTSIHWHGLRQLGNNIQDGVNGVTECPLAPGASKTYTFNLTQYGTTWYHSHYSAQYANGVFGAIVINGPASANYDIDLGAYPINDFYVDSADEIVEETRSTPAPPSSNNVFFNGTNINPSGSGGAYSTIDLTPGSVHLLRLYNPSAEHNYEISIVGHNMTVIETDLVPVEPVTVDYLFLAIGQRANVLINATATAGNYWMNVTLPSTNLCGASDNPYPAAILHYTSAESGNPTDQGTTPFNPGCQDSLSYVPVVSRTADLDDFAQTASNTFDISDVTSPTVLWYVNSSSIDVDWEYPVVSYVMSGNTSYPTDENIVTVSETDVWTYWIIENASAVPHPLHLHGHDFLVLGVSAESAGDFTSSDIDSLNVDNPTRRDVTMLPALGWVVLAFKSDNPGAWLFHCHIAWHVSGGLALDFLERPDDQAAQITTAEKTAYKDNCATWDSYWNDADLTKIDSGLKKFKARELPEQFLPKRV
ncbi:laccase [Xylariaceae sp. FL0255]|nr:laccase [Xylariaceae sp. FL0255]